ncbi:Uncharacterised protein [Klebsiella pneumoniae]|nr:Uncharacterised protein [Klebsiella pneumoniae]
MTVCRLCQCEPMVMTKPETDGITYFYVHYVECSGWICPYISRHLLSLNPLLARCRRYSRGER